MSLSPQSDLSRPSSTADSWGRYYTAEWVSQQLVCAIHAPSPKLIVELGTGTGSLAAAAAAKWSQAQFVTVDTDRAAKKHLDRLKSHKAHTHHTHDVLDDALADRIGLGLGSVDVGICNPPFVRPRWRASFGRILEDAGLSGALQSVHDAGADLLFIAQNLRLLRRKGKLGLILPDGLVTAEKFKGVRTVLLREHSVEQVVQLPRGVFAGTEAQTYLVVLTKQGGETQSVALTEMGPDGVLSLPVRVPADLARRRLDFGFHSVAHLALPQKNRARRLHMSVRDVTTSILRGTVSSNQIEGLRWPVFHLSDFSAVRRDTRIPAVPGMFQLTARDAAIVSGTLRLAQPGHILVARIGRNLQDKVCMVRDGPCIISDCIFALDVGEPHREVVLAYLLSEQGRRALAASAHGVGARYLSRADLLDLPLPIR